MRRWSTEDPPPPPAPPPPRSRASHVVLHRPPPVPPSISQPPCCAFKIPSSSSRSPCSPRLPAHRAPRGGPARGARGSSTFHAECIKVPVNCALTSQGELGKAPRGLVLLAGPAGESITTWPQETAAQSVQGAGRGSPQPSPSGHHVCPAGRGGAGPCREAATAAWPPVLPPAARTWPGIAGPQFSPLQNGSATAESPAEQLTAVGRVRCPRCPSLSIIFANRNDSRGLWSWS